MTRFGEAIRERREWVGFETATACALASERLELDDPRSYKAFSQSSLSRWELDKTGSAIESAHGKSLRTLAYLLRWTSTEFEANVGVPIGRVPQLEDPLQTDDGAFLDRLGEPVNLTVSIPQYGSVAAGIVGFERRDTPVKYSRYAREELPASIEDPTRLFLVRANGSSMYQEGMPRPVPDGAWLIVEIGASPRNGDIVIAYIEERDIGVVKEYREEAEATLLRSYKRGGPAFWTSDYPEMRIVGVVRRITYEP